MTIHEKNFITTFLNQNTRMLAVPQPGHMIGNVDVCSQTKAYSIPNKQLRKTYFLLVGLQLRMAGRPAWKMQANQLPAHMVLLLVQQALGILQSRGTRSS